MKIFIVLFLAAVTGLSAGAANHNAATCSASDVQTAINLISANGDTVTIPSTSCTWTTTVTAGNSFSWTLIGGGSVATSDSHGNPLTYTDSTNITDGFTVDTPILDVSLNGSSGQVFTMTGITFHGPSSSNPSFNGITVVDGNTGTQARVWGNHYVNMANLALSMYLPMTGVVDHNLFDVPNGQLWNGVRVFYTGDSWGDEPWTVSDTFGTANQIYLENNTFNNGFPNDCEHGGAFTARYNSVYWGQASQNSSFQTHATGSGDRGRGCREIDVYGNWGAPKAGCGSCTLQFVFTYISSGTGVVFGNSIDETDNGDVYLISNRDNNDTYSQTATPNGWGYCGTTFNGTGSNWDQNANSAKGGACIDQPGRGIGQLLSGYWPSVVNTSTGTIAWPNQARDPIYIWNEIYPHGASNPLQIHSPNGNIVANSDYYASATGVQTSPTSPFNGTTGTGWGTLSNRPTTCTAGVGYGVTTGTTTVLYVCGPTNTWTTKATTYTYPHPLVQNLISTTTGLSASTTTPVAGTNVTLTASVTPSSGPTGTVQFFDGGSSIGTQTLTSGSAAQVVTAITAGVHTYTAVYSGDSTYATSTSSPVTVTASSGGTGGGIKAGVTAVKGVVIK